MYAKEDWKVKENDNGLLSIPIEDGLIISATRPGNQVGLTPKQANLIASAPKMLGALEALEYTIGVCPELLAVLNDHPVTYAMIREALAKVRSK